MDIKTLFNPVVAVWSTAPETFSISGLEIHDAQAVADRVAARVRGVEVLAVRARGWMGLGDTCEVTIRGSNGARRSFRRNMRRLARSVEASEI